MRRIKSATVLGLIGMVFCLGIGVGMHLQSADAAPAEIPRIYELRTYTTPDGKLDDLHNRFANHTNHLFVKHGISLVGYWTLADGDGMDNTLVYIVAHEDRESAAANWRAFGADDDWKKAAADSRKNGRLVTKVDSQYLIPTDYSPIR